MTGLILSVGGTYEDAKLWTPMKAFVKKVPSLRYWMGGVIESSEAKEWP